MLLTVLVFVLNGPPPPGGCTLSGKVDFRREGKPASPGGRVVVYLDEKVSLAVKPPPKVHEIRQKGLEFIPAVLVVQRNDEVQFVNDDNDNHSVFSNSKTTSIEFQKSKKGITGSKKFYSAGPVRILCGIHAFMRADVLVLENPWFSVVDANGNWQLSGLSEGDHTLSVWEPNGATSTVTVKQCAGATRVVVPPLEEAPKPKRVPPPVPPENGGY